MTLATEVDKWKRIRSLLSFEDVRDLDRLLKLRDGVEALADEVHDSGVAMMATADALVDATETGSNMLQGATPDFYLERRLRKLLEGK